MSTERQKGYSQGYVAGRRKGRSERAPEMTDQQFWDEAYLKALPWALEATGWTYPKGDAQIKITSVEQRTHRLAAGIANESLRARKKRFP